MEIFEGPQDEFTGLEWMKGKIGETVKSLKKDKDKEGFSDEKRDRLDQGIDLNGDISARINSLKVDSSIPDEGLELGTALQPSLWERFIFVMTGKDLGYYEEQGRTCPYSPGEWDDEVEEPIEFGWSDCFIKTEVPKKGSTKDFATHFYHSLPSPQKWEMTQVEQKGREFLIGSVEVGQIDAFCSVPQLPKEMSSSETAGRVLNKKKGGNQWQRRVDRKRVGAIKRFIGKSDSNLVANSVILYVPPNQEAVSFNGGTVTINPSKYLQKLRSKNYCSSRGHRDLRPIWLIDGQHRTRGLAQSERGIGLKIPVILFPSDFELSEAAKIFSEINTLQVNLSPLHKLFMQHRFSISSTQATRDFTKPWIDSRGKVDNVNSRANHMAYECAAALSADEKGALHNRIQFLDSNGSSVTIMKANSWVDYARKWFVAGGAYEPDTPHNQKWVNEEVGNFFEAFRLTCNHSGWKKSGAPNPNRARWSKSSAHKGVIHSHSSSKALLMIYNKAWRKARAGGAVPTDEVISVSRFKEVLSPLKWCDWIAPEVAELYKGSGEPPRTALILWMTAAIDHGVTYDYDEVMSDELKSQPGRGFLAPPGKGVLNKVSEEDWPTENRPISFKAEQPPHAFASASILVRDSEGTDRVSIKKRAKDGYFNYELRHQSWMKSTEKIVVRVSWHNRKDPPGFREITLTKG